MSLNSIREKISLQGRTAVVTGGAGHIGRVISASLIELGAKVAILDKGALAGREVADRLCQIRSDSAFSVPCDLKSESQSRKALRAAIQQLNGLNILVHCAAFVGSDRIPGWNTSFEKQSVQAWEAAMRVNLTSAFTLAQEGKQALEMGSKGSVILFSSIYGMVGPDWSLYNGTKMSNPAAYNASKGGLLQLTRYLATALAPRIRVNAISPGGVWRHQPEAFLRRYKQKTPLKRMATEEDLAGAVVYLASDLSSYVTGHNLVVDGGWTTW